MLPVSSMALIIGVFIYLWLTIMVIVRRRKYKVAVGDGDHVLLRQAIRAHQNYMEYTPIFLLLLILSEMAAAPLWSLVTLSVLFGAGRGFHAYSMLFAERFEDGQFIGPVTYRVLGMMGTLLALIFGALLLILSVLYYGEASL